jgi:ribonuclease D
MSETMSTPAREQRPEFVNERAPVVVAEDLPTGPLQALVSDGIVACDIETSGLDWRNDRIATFQLFGRTAGTYVVRLNGDVPIRLSRLLADESVCKVFHHAPFDLRFVLAQWGVRTSNVKCTKIASKLIFRDAPAEAHSLKELLHRVAEVEISKDQRLSNWSDDDLSGEQIEYAAKDVVYLIPLLEVLESLASSKGLLDLLDRSFAHLPTRAELDVLGYEDIYAY